MEHLITKQAISEDTDSTTIFDECGDSGSRTGLRYYRSNGHHYHRSEPSVGQQILHFVHNSSYVYILVLYGHIDFHHDEQFLVSPTIPHHIAIENYHIYL